MDRMAAAPLICQPTVTTQVMREILLHGDGWMTAQGRAWNIIGEPLGAGVFRLRLIERD